MLSMLAKLLKILNSEADPAQISLAFCFSLFPGFLPFFSIYTILVFLIVFLLRVNLAAFFLGIIFFKGIAYLLDPLLGWIGLSLLTIGPLEGLWTAMYNSTFWRLQQFNNSVVMGSLVFSVLIFVPLFFLSNMAVHRYRDRVLARIRNTRFMQVIKATKLYSLYSRVTGWREQS